MYVGFCIVLLPDSVSKECKMSRIQWDGVVISERSKQGILTTVQSVTGEEAMIVGVGQIHPQITLGWGGECRWCASWGVYRQTG
jgi:hypothetical protein